MHAAYLGGNLKPLLDGLLVEGSVMTQSRERSIGEEVYSEDETERRRHEALKRALSTPHNLHSEMKLGKGRKAGDNPKARPAIKGRPS
jgi:hypothetical protein